MFLLVGILSLSTFANTFEWKGSHSFFLRIDARTLVYESPGLKFKGDINPCNLPLARGLNAELMGLVPLVNEPDEGGTFRVDGNSYLLSRGGKRASILNVMDKKIEFYQAEEKKACPKKKS